MDIGDLSAYPKWEVHAGSGVARTVISPSAVGAFPIPLTLASQGGKLTALMKGRCGSRSSKAVLTLWVSHSIFFQWLICFHHPIYHNLSGALDGTLVGHYPTN
jgi:hypothetical protein